jgi:hypothetical protein
MAIGSIAAFVRYLCAPGIGMPLATKTAVQIRTHQTHLWRGRAVPIETRPSPAIVRTYAKQLSLAAHPSSNGGRKRTARWQHN